MCMEMHLHQKKNDLQCLIGTEIAPAIGQTLTVIQFSSPCKRTHYVQFCIDQPTNQPTNQANQSKSFIM